MQALAMEWLPLRITEAISTTVTRPVMYGEIWKVSSVVWVTALACVKQPTNRAARKVKNA